MAEGSILRRERPLSLQVFPRCLPYPPSASHSFSGPGGPRCFLAPTHVPSGCLTAIAAALGLQWSQR